MSTVWLAGIMQEGSLPSPSKGDTGILWDVHQKPSADAEMQRRNHWGHPRWSHLACTPWDDLQPRMCSSHTAEHQDLASTLRPVGYPLTLVNSPIGSGRHLSPWPMLAQTPTRQWKQKESVLSWSLAKKHIQSIHSVRRTCLLAKEKLCQHWHPGLIFFTEDVDVGLKLRCFLSSKDYFKLHREQLLNKLCKYRKAAANSFHLLS